MKAYVNMIVTAVFVAVAAVGVAFLSRMLDTVLTPCGTGRYDGEACVCVEPYTGTHCEVINCGYGSIVSSVWLVDTITTKAGDDVVSGCKCDNQWWGVNCDQCTSYNKEECIGTCDVHFYGPRCEVLCMADESGLRDDIVAHEDARGEANWHKPTRGLCTSEGKVACLRDSDDLYFTGDHCEYKCPDCKNGGVCNYDENGAFCDCADGFAGQVCEKECPLRCSGLNGLCEIVNDEAVCNCALGRTGSGCEHTCCIRGARTSLGVKMGKCKKGGGCDCDTGYKGPDCDCSNTTCNDNGVCSDSGKCECTSHFNGTRCEYCSNDWVGPLCQIFRKNCTFHGEFSVINKHGDYGCVCDPGFVGDDCELCADNAYPKPDGSNQDIMCTSIVPASMCHNGHVVSNYDAIRRPDMVMCNCTGNFRSETDCETCKDNYYGPQCDVYCAEACFDSKGTCMNSVPGCFCPGSLELNVDTQSCVNCGAGDCENGGVCYNGLCQCDPGFFGDRCEVSAPKHDGKVCNGEFGSSRLTTYEAPCMSKDDCVDTSHPDLLNKKMALQVERYKWEDSMVCYRTDTPQALRTVSGCCVDRDADGRCDKGNLTIPQSQCEDVPIMGEYVYDICDNRVLEGEVNVFEWCLSKQRGCEKNGECDDPELCGDYVPGLTPAEWESRWVVDHTVSMSSLMSEVWRFPIGIEDPYPYRKWYDGIELTEVCAVPGMYTTCRDLLIPDVEVFTFNPDEKRLFRDGWQPMPEFGGGCDVTWFKEYNFENPTNMTVSLGPFHVDRIHVTGIASVYAIDESGSIVPGNPERRISGLEILAKGTITITLYDYKDDECERLQKRAGRHFTDCENVDIVELDYDWGPFCQWQRPAEGGFVERDYQQSLTCVGCENYQEGCEGLPLDDKPMPSPCDVGLTAWLAFCDVYMGESMVEGACARMDCDCMDGPLGIGGEACQYNCPVPRGFTSPCGEGEDPPLGRCVGQGGFSIGTTRGTCECFNPVANPSEGCVVTCDEETFSCSKDVDTPFSFRSMGCDYENVQSSAVLPGAMASTTQGLKPFTSVTYGECNTTFESYGDACFTDGVDVFLGNHIAEDMECDVLLPDSVCNALYGRCECATPYSVLSSTGMKYFNPDGNYRAALMQGYDIDEYVPFMTYTPPFQSFIKLESENTYCPADGEFRFKSNTCSECLDKPVCYETSQATDMFGDTCAEYVDGDNCGDYDVGTLFKEVSSGTCESNGFISPNKEQCEYAALDSATTFTLKKGPKNGCVRDAGTEFYEYDYTMLYDFSVAPTCSLDIGSALYEYKGAYCNGDAETFQINNVGACAIACMGVGAKSFHVGETCRCTSASYRDCSTSVSADYDGYSLLYTRVNQLSCEHHGYTTIHDTELCNTVVTAFGGFTSESTATMATGCNMAGFTSSSDNSCTDCVCANIPPPSKYDGCMVTVTSATCEYHGYYSITSVSDCAAILGTSVSATDWSGAPYGCSRINGAAYVGSKRETPCTECFCSTRMCAGEPDPKYVVSNGCVSNGYYPITDVETCNEAKRVGGSCGYELGVVPGTAPYYISDTCDYWLTTKEECVSAAFDLGLPLVTLTHEPESGKWDGPTQEYLHGNCGGFCVGEDSIKIPYSYRIKDLKWHPQNKYFITAEHDNKLMKVYDLKGVVQWSRNTQNLFEISPDGSNILVGEYTHDFEGNYFYTCRVQIYDTATGQLLRSYVDTNRDCKILSVMWSTNGRISITRHLVTDYGWRNNDAFDILFFDENLILVDTLNGNNIGYTHRRMRVRVSPDGQKIISEYTDTDIYDLSGQLLRSFESITSDHYWGVDSNSVLNDNAIINLHLEDLALGPTITPLEGTVLSWSSYSSTIKLGIRIVSFEGPLNAGYEDRIIGILDVKGNSLKKLPNMRDVQKAYISPNAQLLLLVREKAMIFEIMRLTDCVAYDISFQSDKIVSQVNDALVAWTPFHWQSQDFVYATSNTVQTTVQTRYEYFVKTSGTCDHYITTAAECEQAVISLGRTFSHAADFNSVSFTRGCITSSNSYFNTAASVYADECGSAGYACVCKAGRTLTIPKYSVQTTGTCNEYMTTAAECEEAANSLGSTYQGTRNLPNSYSTGCIIAGDTTYLNVNTFVGECGGSGYLCICKEKVTSLSMNYMGEVALVNGAGVMIWDGGTDSNTQLFEMDATLVEWSPNGHHVAALRQDKITFIDPNTGDLKHFSAPKYFVKTSGTCDHYITTAAECDEAANSLGRTFSHAVDFNSASWTRGCITGSTSYFNTAASGSGVYTDQCGSAGYNCICKTNMYNIKNSGTCDHYITTAAECEEAANSLGRTFSHAVDFNSASWTRGCITGSSTGSTSYFNTAASGVYTDQCGSAAYNCVCKDGVTLDVSKVKSIAWWHMSNQLAILEDEKIIFTHVSDYTVIESGSCEQNGFEDIANLEECTEASAFLKATHESYDPFVWILNQPGVFDGPNDYKALYPRCWFIFYCSTRSCYPRIFYNENDVVTKTHEESRRRQLYWSDMRIICKASNKVEYISPATGMSWVQSRIATAGDTIQTWSTSPEFTYEIFPEGTTCPENNAMNIAEEVKCADAAIQLGFANPPNSLRQINEREDDYGCPYCTQNTDPTTTQVLHMQKIPSFGPWTMLQSCKPVCMVYKPKEITEIQASASTVAVSPDANKIAAGADDGTLKIWDISGELLHTFTGYSGDSISWNADNVTVMSGTSIWRLNLNSVISYPKNQEGEIKWNALGTEFVSIGTHLRIQENKDTCRLFDKVNGMVESSSHLRFGTFGDVFQEVTQGPPCSISDNNVYFNPTPTQFTGDHLCGFTPISVETEQICAYDPPKDFVVVESHTCAHFGYLSVKKEDCASAAAQLGFVYDTVDFSTNSYPSGCIRQPVTDKIRFNIAANDVTCDASSKCLCYRLYSDIIDIGQMGCEMTESYCMKASGIMKTSFDSVNDDTLPNGCTVTLTGTDVKWNSFIWTEPYQNSNTVVDSTSNYYYIKPSGFCNNYITTAAECEEALISLGRAFSGLTNFHSYSTPRGCISQGPSLGQSFFNPSTSFFALGCGSFACVCKYSSPISVHGSNIAKGLSNGNIQILDYSGTLKNTLTGHSAAVMDLAWSPDGSKLVSGSMLGNLRIWNSDGSLIISISAHSQMVLSVDWKLDGSKFSSSSQDRNIKVYDSNGNFVNTRMYTKEAQAVVWGDNNLYTVSGNYIIKWYETPSIHSLTPVSGWMTSLSLSPDGSIMAAGNSVGGLVYLTFDEAGKLTTLAQTNLMYSQIQSIDWITDSSQVVVAIDADLKVLDTSTSLLYTLTGHTDNVNSVVFTNDMIVSSSTSEIKFWTSMNVIDRVFLCSSKEPPPFPLKIFNERMEWYPAMKVCKAVSESPFYIGTSCSTLTSTECDMAKEIVPGQTLDETCSFTRSESTITFTGTIGTSSYTVDGTVCGVVTVSKTFSGHPLKIVAGDLTWNEAMAAPAIISISAVGTETFTMTEPVYTYICESHSAMIGKLEPQCTQKLCKVEEECGTNGNCLCLNNIEEKDVCDDPLPPTMCEASGGTMTDTCRLNGKVLCGTMEKSFDAYRDCCGCGGGEKRGLTKSAYHIIKDGVSECVCSEDTACNELDSDSTMYSFDNSEYPYVYVGKGACSNMTAVAVEGSSIPERLGFCAAACSSMNRDGFGLNNTHCMCTEHCDNDVPLDRFGFTESFEVRYNVASDVIIQAWDVQSRHLRCFKDIQKTEEVMCSHIRALKHFARGTSYRVGDCTHEASGTKDQIPCNGRGFVVSGTCYCDYAETLDISQSALGIQYEPPTLLQTPYRGKGCGHFCPGYNMRDMSSVCSGHGVCASTGTCDCDQSFAGYRCHVQCELEPGPLTCSGHGTCEEQDVPFELDDSYEIRDTLRSWDEDDCSKDYGYLAQDKVVRIDNDVHYMFRDLSEMRYERYTVSIGHFFMRLDTAYCDAPGYMLDRLIFATNPIDFTADCETTCGAYKGFNVNFKDRKCQCIMQIDVANCNTWTDNSGDIVGTLISNQYWEVYARTEGDVMELQEERTASMDDYYIFGELYRKPYGSEEPHMPCYDTVLSTREKLSAPLIDIESDKLQIPCAVLPNYRVVCGACKCFEHDTLGHFTGYNCRTPSAGYYGVRGTKKCRGMTDDNLPCNGHGTCNWGSLLGLGKQVETQTQCFCGVMGDDVTFNNAPRNNDGDVMVHVDNLGDPLYVRTIKYAKADCSSDGFGEVLTAENCREASAYMGSAWEEDVYRTTDGGCTRIGANMYLTKNEAYNTEEVQSACISSLSTVEKTYTTSSDIRITDPKECIIAVKSLSNDPNAVFKIQRVHLDEYAPGCLEVNGVFMLNTGSGTNCGTNCIYKNDVLNKKQRSYSFELSSFEQDYNDFCRFDSNEFVSVKTIYISAENLQLGNENLTPVYFEGKTYYNVEDITIIPETNSAASNACVENELFGITDVFLNTHQHYETETLAECIKMCIFNGINGISSIFEEAEYAQFDTYQYSEGSYYDPNCNFGIGCNVFQSASTLTKCWCNKHNTEADCLAKGLSWIPTSAESDNLVRDVYTLNPPGRGIDGQLVTLTSIIVEVPQTLHVKDVVCYANDYCPPL